MPAALHTPMESVHRDAIEHARRYPFAIPEHSFVYLDGKSLELAIPVNAGLAEAMLHVDGETRPLALVARAAGVDPATLLSERTAVLSFGSNASPEHLARKFSGMPGPVLIPVLRGTLAGFDAVYSAHIASYGSVPAALAASPGCAVRVYLNLLDAAQLRVMHQSEGVGRNYAFSRLRDVELTLEGGTLIRSPCFYRSCGGVLTDAGNPIALAAIPARHRVFPALDESGALDWVRCRLAPEADLDAFIAANIASPEHRAANIQALAAFSAPAEFPHEDIPV